MFERSVCYGGGGGGSPGPTQDQYAQQKVNAELWNHYQQNYQPYIDKFTAQTLQNAPQQENAVQGKLNADIMKALPRPGANPVADTAAIAGATDVAAGAKEIATGKAKERTLGSMQNLVNIGRGQATQAQAGLSDIASQSLQREIGMNNINQQQQTSMVNTLGSAVGTELSISNRPTNRTLAAV